MDSRRRAFTGAVREFIRARDQICRIPNCGAPIRDIDHVERFADGGETTIENGVGLCQRHNLAKEMPGWTAQLVPATEVGGITTDGQAASVVHRDSIANRVGQSARPGADEVLIVQTPSGHRAMSAAPTLHQLVGVPLDGRHAQPDTLVVDHARPDHATSYNDAPVSEPRGEHDAERLGTGPPEDPLSMRGDWYPPGILEPEDIPADDVIMPGTESGDAELGALLRECEEWWAVKL